MPTRSTSQLLPPQGWAFFISSTSPTWMSIPYRSSLLPYTGLYYTSCRAEPQAPPPFVCQFRQNRRI